MRKLILSIFIFLLVAACGLAAAITFGGPGQPPPLRSVSDPLRSADFSGLPPVERFAARDGAQLAYRCYGRNNASTKGTVVLVHGSSSRSNTMHPLAMELEKSGYAVYALDMRGHGDSGVRGQIAYIGQLEDDLEDFMKQLRNPGKRTLVGFSSGGGFVLRFAADPRGALFSNFVLLSPFLGQDASTYRPNSGGWVAAGMPRIIGLVVLNEMGMTRLNHLPVVSYAVAPERRPFVTAQYSYNLAMNFRPHRDFRADIAAVMWPMEVLVGQKDEQFIPDRFSHEFAAAGKKIPVSILPEVGHMDLVLKPAAIQACISAVDRLNARPNL